MPNAILQDLPADIESVVNPLFPSGTAVEFERLQPEDNDIAGKIPRDGRLVSVFIPSVRSGATITPDWAIGMDGEVTAIALVEMRVWRHRREYQAMLDEAAHILATLKYASIGVGGLIVEGDIEMGFIFPPNNRDARVIGVLYRFEVPTIAYTREEYERVTLQAQEGAAERIYDKGELLAGA